LSECSYSELIYPRLLLVLVILGLGYLSLYPFQFTREAHQTGMEWRHLRLDSDWVDIIANFLGYLPLGFLAMAAWRRSGPSAVAAVTLAGALFSCGIEWAQLYLPTRDSNLWDLTFNTFGTLAGSVLFPASQRIASRFRWNVQFPRPDATSCVLILSWILWQAFPFLPALRRYKLREFVALLPVWNFHRVEFVDILLAVFALYAFLASPERKSIQCGSLVFLIVFPVLLAQSLISTLAFSNVRVMAAFIGLALAMLLWGRQERAQWIILAAVLCSWLVLRENGAVPLARSPFDAFVRILAGKTFLYFSGLALVWRAADPLQRWKWRWS
jgi:VanZ family protein